VLGESSSCVILTRWERRIDVTLFTDLLLSQRWYSSPLPTSKIGKPFRA
jgi:hypothetical protein